MRRFRLILLIGLLLASAAYLGGYYIGTAKPRSMLRSGAPELAWLKEEFHLGDAEFKRISELHESYLPDCATRCARIDEVNEELKSLLASEGGVTLPVERKLAEAAALRLECQKAMLRHFLAVSKAMPPDQGKRYLAWIEQQTFMPEHRMAAHHH
jgi:hypothetical protein